ncbi:MAG: cytochrome c [Nitrospira sp.]
MMENVGLEDHIIGTSTMPAFLTAAARSGRPGIVCMGSLCLAISLMAGPLLWAGSSSPAQPGHPPQDTEQGREIFNGKGLCSTCHGVDGHKGRLPPHLTPNIRDNIAHLDPAPADLRQATALTLTTDKQRFEIIRRGHLRTAMYPLSKDTLSNEEILALLPYLASIRGTVPPPASAPASSWSLRGDANNGRQLYHELGGCAICHGIDGQLHSRPPMSADLVARLNALPRPPADLRHPANQTSQSDEDLYRSIKLGHPGTAMYPKTLLRDEDIRDLIAYLAVLREGGR